MRHEDLLDEIRQTCAQLEVLLQGARDEESRARAGEVCSVYLFEFVKRWNTQGMTQDRARELALKVMHRQLRREGPRNLEKELTDAALTIDPMPASGPPAGDKEVPGAPAQPPDPGPSEAGPPPGPPPPRSDERVEDDLGGDAQADLPYEIEGVPAMTSWKDRKFTTKMPDTVEERIEKLQKAKAAAQELLGGRELPPRAIAVGNPQGEPVDTRFFDCPRCSAPISSIDKTCSGCGTHIRRTG